jgi:predicted nucleic acid-binding protein
VKLGVIDTNVASFFFGRRPELALYEDDCRRRRLEVSFQTVGELLQGAEKKNWGAERRRALRAFISTLRVVPYDMGLVKTWARVTAVAISNGRALTDGDGWIAATAVYRRATLITHDTDFVDLPIHGLDVICRAPDERP